MKGQRMYKREPLWKKKKKKNESEEVLRVIIYEQRKGRTIADISDS